MQVPALFAITWQELAGWLALFYLVVSGLTLVWIMSLKRDSMAAVAWALTVVFIPYIGVLLFYFFGYQSIHRPVQRKRRHAEAYRRRLAQSSEAVRLLEAASAASWQGIAQLAQRVGADPLMPFNRVQLYHEGQPAFDSMLEAIGNAKHHVHLEMFIFRWDPIGQRFIEALAERARNGVQVRFLYDGVGCWKLGRRQIEALSQCGGSAEAFLPVKLFRRRLQINLRNHRKILVVDGRVGFTGGLNIGEEYLGRNPFFGPWRDTFFRLEGPAVTSLQRVFMEDWDFSSTKKFHGDGFFPAPEKVGDTDVQVVSSGPDQDLKAIREVFFAAITRARSRIWIASPYFVPDGGLLDALTTAAWSGVDVRLLLPFRPDKWVPFLAARYYWENMLAAGVKIYQYTPGFIHAKVVLVDDRWSSVGTANFDNRSLRLNFEVNCLFESERIAKELQHQFERDFAVSIRVDRTQFSQRPFVGRLAENAFRLLSPLL